MANDVVTPPIPSVTIPLSDGWKSRKFWLTLLANMLSGSMVVMAIYQSSPTVQLCMNVCAAGLAILTNLGYFKANTAEKAIAAPLKP